MAHISLAPSPAADPGEAFGRTIGDALEFMGEADTCLIRVPVGDGGFNYLSIPADVVLIALSSHDPRQPMPCCLQRRTLTLGDAVAIIRADSDCPACHLKFKDGDTCRNGGCPMGAEFSV